MTSVLSRCGLYCLQVVLLVCATGCGGAGGSIDLGEAAGTVTYQGRPVSGAIVMAYPESGPIASGFTDNDGKFTLSTGSERGVAIGPVKVSVTKNVSSAAPMSGTTPTRGTDFVDPSKTAEMMRARQEGQEAGAGATEASEIPVKYGNPDTSGLAFEIKPGGNDLPLALQ